VFAASEIDGGLCSTEFIVLRPNKEISDQVLRAILASKWVSSQLEKLQIGAALPRVSSKDLLAMKVPLPDKQTQERLERELFKLNQERVTAKIVIASGPTAFESAVAIAIT
jgi:type I restriction enzyme S subunit